MKRFQAPPPRTERSDEKEDTLRIWILECQDEIQKLTKWEMDFLDSVDEQLQTKGWLSVGQVETLGGIRDKALGRRSRR